MSKTWRRQPGDERPKHRHADEVSGHDAVENQLQEWQDELDEANAELADIFYGEGEEC